MTYLESKRVKSSDRIYKAEQPLMGLFIAEKVAGRTYTFEHPNLHDIFIVYQTACTIVNSRNV